MNINIVFPAIVIGSNSIDKINYRYLVADKRYLSTAFKNVKIVDHEGKLFDVIRVENDGGLDLFYSIKLIGHIVRVKPILRGQVKKIDVESLKKNINGDCSKQP